MQRSRSRCGYWLLSVLAMLIVSVAASSVLATEADMARLPIVDPFRCAICHVQETPSMIQHDLNVFGVDFLANGRLWNATLAALNSDDDGCKNGVELCDVDGDGIPDGNETTLRSNPGIHDCGELVIDARTWGALKALFDRP